MAVIHRTTLTPSKLELLTDRLPERPWYAGGGAPRLERAGGFRLDDPAGEVGLELAVVNDLADARPVAYFVPMSYRAAPLEGAGHALLGTTEHGVLGRRWVYDAAHDPVAVRQLLALTLGLAEAQAQSVSDTPDPTVERHFAGSGQSADVESFAAADTADGTRITVRTAAAPGSRRDLVLALRRVLRPLTAEDGTAEPLGHVTAGYLLPDGTGVRGRYAVVRGGAEG